MGAYSMEASQINYRGGDTKMSVEDALRKAGKGGIDFKELEFDTNNKWLDGRKIMGKVILVTEDTPLPTGSSNPGLIPAGITDDIDVIDLFGILTATVSDNKISIPIVKMQGNVGGNVAIEYNHTTGNLELMSNNGTLSQVHPTGYIGIYYCKVEAGE